MKILIFFFFHYYLYVCMCIHIYIIYNIFILLLLSTFLLWSVKGFKADHSDEQPIGVHHQKGLILLLSVLACSSLSKCGALKNFPSSMLICALILPCSSLVYALISRRNCFITDFSAFWLWQSFCLPQPQCSVSHRRRSYDADVSVGAWIPTLCWSLHCTPSASQA